jgi:hypothetical protein
MSDIQSVNLQESSPCSIPIGIESTKASWSVYTS